MNTNNQAKLALCPHCQSTFLASEEELNLALGAVRCGDCMKIFNASYHFVAVSVTSSVETHKITSEQTNHIPTLNEHPQDTKTVALNSNEGEQDPLSEEDQDEYHYIDSLLDSKSSPNQDTTKKDKKLTAPIFIGLALVAIPLLIGGWFIFNHNPPLKYEFSEINLSPSKNLKQMDLHFVIKNISEQALPLPSLNIELLNLSYQVVSSEIISSTSLHSNLVQLDAASSYPMTVTVKRPTTFVQTARIQPYLDDTKL